MTTSFLLPLDERENPSWERPVTFPLSCYLRNSYSPTPTRMSRAFGAERTPLLHTGQQAAAKRAWEQVGTVPGEGGCTRGQRCAGTVGCWAFTLWLWVLVIGCGPGRGESEPSLSNMPLDTDPVRDSAQFEPGSSIQCPFILLHKR